VRRIVDGLVALLLAVVMTGCSVLGPRHELTFEVSGSAPVLRKLTVDLPGKQAADATTQRRVQVPWRTTETTGFGFARLVATADEGRLTCRILDGDTVVATGRSDPDGRVEYRVNVQDG